MIKYQQPITVLQRRNNNNAAVGGREKNEAKQYHDIMPSPYRVKSQEASLISRFLLSRAPTYDMHMTKAVAEHYV